VELLDEVLLIVVDAEGEQVERAHAAHVAAVLQFVDQFVSLATERLLAREALLDDSEDAEDELDVGVLHGEM